MRLLMGAGLAFSLLVVVGITLAQPPGGGRGKFSDKGGEKGGGGKGGPGMGRAASVEEMVNKLMAFDKNKDGVLTKEEMGDSRLAPLFDKANTSKSGKLTREELTSYLTKESAKLGNNGGGPDGFGKGPGGKDGKKGGRGGFGKDKGSFDGKKGGFDGPPPRGEGKGPPPQD